MGTVLSVNEGNQPLPESSLLWSRKCIFPGLCPGDVAHLECLSGIHKALSSTLLSTAYTGHHGACLWSQHSRDGAEDEKKRIRVWRGWCGLWRRGFQPHTAPCMVLWFPGEECFSLGVDIVRALVSRCSLSTARLKIKCAADRGGSRFWLRVCSVAGAVGLVPRRPWRTREPGGWHSRPEAACPCGLWRAPLLGRGPLLRVSLE